MFTFQPRYFLLTIIFFIAEVYIALYVNDTIIRPFVGDLLVVIMTYAGLRTFFRVNIYPAAFSVLAFAYFVETLQYFRLIFHLGWQDSLLAHLIIGSSFHWLDILMYTAGILIVIFFESLKTTTAR